ncbi:RNA polymerase sigma factor [candidate division WOR-3 bacterium]|nr:RNA polymerase sigma factor [candidate division WOR-3 bacterium]
MKYKKNENDIISQAAEDLSLVEESLNGKQEALEKLIRKYQSYVYNISFKMLGDREEARDASQEIFIKTITNLKNFGRKSSFKTWLFRIMLNHLLDCRKSHAERKMVSFERYAFAIRNTPDTTLENNPVEAKILCDETRNHCLMGMILCLDRRHRFAFIIGELLGLEGEDGAQIVGVSRQNFRQMLSRSRRKILSFMKENCGIINNENQCKCEKKAGFLFKRGLVLSENREYGKNFGTLKRECAERSAALSLWFEEASKKLFLIQPIENSPDFSSLIRKIVDQKEIEAILGA